MKTRIALIGIAFLCATQASAATALHHYSFDAAAVTDLIGSEDGTLLNGAAVSSGVLITDGVDDYVQFNAPLVPTSDYSVAFSAREDTQSGTYAELISQGQSGGPGFYIGYDPSHNFRLTDNHLSTSIPFPSDHEFHHFALTSSGAESLFYRDGTLVASLSPSSFGGGGSGTRLGRQFAPYDEFFSGALDELWIYSGVLTASEVTTLATVPEPCSLALILGSIVFGTLTFSKRRNKPLTYWAMSR